MTVMKTSESHPLRIDEVVPDDYRGRIGITLCPGKKDPCAWTGAWNRDLDLDLDVVQRWGATAVITLIVDHEMHLLQVPGLREAVESRHMEWWHLPIPDVEPPGPDFERAWKADAGEAIRDRLRLGFDVLIHCRGGLGRAGTVAARLLVELGESCEDAIRKVRRSRPGAIQTPEQEAHVRAVEPPPPIVPPGKETAIRDRAVGGRADG